ncbi:cationic amino acid transporter 4 isoform X1 [Schistocerca gregaria]|uniref:cationic amino acid transporter 4 isoform X1 n=2 Tax=Schistocerca TaxID=7008 RepID=UPI00211EF9FB|nr:cationic amino acid transporter 4 isoform X1 [Schistocerca gregaria]
MIYRPRKMPSTRKMILQHVMTDVSTKMNRTKKMGMDVLETPLNRCLSTLDITLLGVGHMVGAGIYVMIGPVARDIAGPGIVLSFMLAGLTSLLAALCYAEFGTRIPKAGSAYVYTYISIGEFWAFIIGWNIILEHMIGAASVARAWSGYVDSLSGRAISNATLALTGGMHEPLLAPYPDFLAAAVCVAFAALLAAGVKGSALVNSLLTVVNLAVMAVIVVVGFWYARFENWVMGGFLPYGLAGVTTGAATLFYAFVGFDSIATSGEEAMDPSVSIPKATIVSMSVVTLSYVLVSAALTMVQPFSSIVPDAALPEAFASLGLPWVRWAVALGALSGMTTTLFGSLFALPRCMYAMAADGLLFSCLGRINQRTQVPIINLAISGICTGLIAALFDLKKLVEFMSIGTLLAYTIVSASVIVLRYRPPTPEETAVLGLEIPSDDSSQSSFDLSWPQAEMLELVSAGHLKSSCNWMRPLVGGCSPGSAVSGAIFVFICLSVAFAVQVQLCENELRAGVWWAVLMTSFLFFCLCGCVLVMGSHQQNTLGLRFKVPYVPIIPSLSIFFNIALMVNLPSLTWVRFVVWMAVGLLVYFLYGIHHSKESDHASSYSILMTSSEAGKIKWGSTYNTQQINPVVLSQIKIAPSAKDITTDEKKPIVAQEEVPK